MFAAILVRFSSSNGCGQMEELQNVQIKVHACSQRSQLSLHVHMHHKKKIALDQKLKVGPLLGAVYGIPL
jgi:hypothetical protein